MALDFTTWREIYGILEAEYQALLSQAGNVPTVFSSAGSRAERNLSRELETDARLQGRGGVVDEACSMFALARRWPPMSRSLGPLVLLRLAAARDLAAFISQPDRVEPEEILEMDCELALRWALVEYWHMGGTSRSLYLKARPVEERKSEVQKQGVLSA